jgi:hypothetical protein
MPTPQASDEPKDHEGVNLRGISRAHGRNEIQDADGEQGFSPPEFFCWPTAEERSDDRAPQRHADGEAVQGAIKSPQLLDGLFRSGNHHGIKAKKKAG